MANNMHDNLAQLNELSSSELITVVLEQRAWIARLHDNNQTLMLRSAETTKACLVAVKRLAGVITADQSATYQDE